jgi:hypothetical protein
MRLQKFKRKGFTGAHVQKHFLILDVYKTSKIARALLRKNLKLYLE